MPVSMTGNPSPPRAGALNNLPAAYRVVAEAAYAKPEPPSPPKSRTRHFEEVHYAKKWQLDMADESTLGIAPPKWSQTSQMGDTRPNGKSMFDARFHNTPMGRARGGHSMVWDSRGVASSGGTTKAVNMDSAFFAADMADETALAAESAERNKYGNNTNFDYDEDMVLAQMSQLQKRQMDKDGDGNLDRAELAAHGFGGQFKEGNFEASGTQQTANSNGWGF